MSNARLKLFSFGLTGLLMAGVAPQAWACAACFGKSDSSMAHGMNMGILSLLVVVVGVLSVLASFFVFLARKSAKANGNTDGQEPAIDSQT